MLQLLRDFYRNLCAGTRLAWLLPVQLERFVSNPNQLVLLLLLDFGTEIGVGYVQHLPASEFETYALPVYALSLLCLLVVAFVFAKLLRNDSVMLLFAIVMLGGGLWATVWLALLDFAGMVPDTDSGEALTWQMQVFVLYSFYIQVRVLWLFAPRRIFKIICGFVLVSLASLPRAYYYQDYNEFWYAPESEEDDDYDPYAKYRGLNAEKILYQQPALLADALAKLKPQRPGVTDVYYLGFAPYAYQNVFSSETAFAKNLFDSRFDTAGRSLNLVNHLSSYTKQPLASETNLALSLKRIGELMDPEEDVLLLFMTSHGSEEHELAVAFWPLPLNDITPQSLAKMLDAAGIKWRVLVVSACYSGGFVAPLQNPNSVIATAAAADRTSFGCSNQAEFTYFGEAVFKDQLPQQDSFIQAFEQAGQAIAAREQREHIDASQPQLSVGSDIRKKLLNLSKELPQRRCTAKQQGAARC